MANGQKFTLSFDAQLNVGQMKGAIGQIQNELNRLQLPQNLTRGITGTLTSLEKEIRNFEVAAGKDLSVKSNFSAFERSAEKISSLYKNLEIQARDLGNNIDLEKFFPASVIQTIDKASQALKDYQATLTNLNRKVGTEQGKVTRATAKQLVAKEDLDKAKQELEQFQGEYNNIINSIFSKAKIEKPEIIDKEAIDQALQELEKLRERQIQIQNDVGPNGKKYNYADSSKENAKQRAQEIEQLIARYRELATTIPSAEKSVEKLTTAYTKATTAVKTAQEALNLVQQAAKSGETDAIGDLFNKLDAAGVKTEGFERNIEGAQAAINAFRIAAGQDATKALEDVYKIITQSNGAFRNNEEAVRQDAEAYKQFDDRVRDVSALKSRIQYFFGLNNAINLVKRAIRGAFDTIKELDKAMTETAVVTNYTVKDMWDQLPEYTKRANQLGVTTKDAYESATLYFQQGLNADQAAALSVETLKMARIAGLDAAEATDRMTNALRGFNMALDEQSAQRVDDVYSQLAAHTASNVDEISTAMTKVASLAHNANMEFETTAAFLAQIIETTRESAETAGTALKTVVARFSEVKKLVSEDQIKGADEEGQVIDVNKVSAALRTAGIDLNKYFIGEVGLDDIFMELASKWDSLTAVQQRYIATQAAGSRQQSRFIALMQDYARTQELVGMAYDAEGASAKQFEKTQDSLQSKLARLKNAWNQFLMGLTNNVIVKGFIDLLTNLLNVVNNLTSAFGEGAGSILKWVTAISAFSGIKALFKGGGFVDKLLMTALSGTGLGNAAVKSGLLSGAGFGGQTYGTPTGGQGPRVGFFGGGVGGLGKKITQGASKLFNLTPTASGNTGAWLFKGYGTSTKLFGAAGTAVPAGTIAGFAAGLIALEVGAIALQDYVASGKAAVKKQEKVIEDQKKQSQETTDLIQKQRDAYQSYIENEKIAQSTTGVEKQQAQAKMAEAATILQSGDSRNVYQAGDELILNKRYAQDYLDILEKQQKAENATVAFEEARLALAQKTVAENKRYTVTDVDEVTGLSYARAEGGSWLEGASHNLDMSATREQLEQQAAVWNAQRTSEAEGFEAQAREKITEGAATLLNGVFKDESLIDTVSSAYASVIDQGAFKEKTTEEIQNDLDDLMHIAQDENGKLLLDVLNGSYEGVITDQDLTQIFENLAPEYQKTLSKLLVTGEKTIEEILGSYNEELKRSQANFRKKVVGNLYKAGLTNVNLLDKIANNLTLSQEQKLSDFAESWSNYGADFNNILLTSVSGAMLDKNWEGSDLQSFIGNIGENPILAFDAIKNAAEDAQSPVHNLAVELKSLIDSGKESAFSKENQVQWFLASSEFDELNDQIEKFIEANGQITSHNIEALAAECETLNTLLENDVISANALAMAISALQSGNVSLFDLNEQVLTLFENFESTTNIIARAGQFIKDFDAGEDWGDAFDFIDDAVEKMTGFVDKRELGNPQLQNYWKAFFTTDPKDISEWEKGIALIKDLQGMGGGDFWTDVVGFSMDEEGIIADMGLEGFASSEFGSYRDYIKSLAESNGYTDFADTYYDLMIRNAGNHDYGFIKDVAAVEIQKIVEAYGEGIGEGVPSKSDIQAIADAYGLDPQALLDAYTEKFDLEHLDFSKLQDKIRETFTAANDFTDGRASINEMLKSFGIGADGTFSLDTLKLKIKEVVPEVADGSISIEDWFNEQVAANGGSVKLPVEYQVPKKLEDGSWTTETIKTTIEVENLDQYEQAVETIQEAANQDILGASIVGALGDANEEAAALVALITDLGSETKLESVTAEIGTATRKAGELNDALSAEINKHVNIIPNQSSVTVGDGGTSVVLHIGVAAKGGIVQSAAAGTIKPGLALTGEEAPEIVWNKEKGYAYLAGANGPEINDLQPGDQVFNGEQTKQILKRSGLKSFAKGTISSYAGTAWAETTDKDKNGSGGSSGNKKSSSEWRNELDWLYDLMEDIAEYERQQSLTQDDYDLALKDIAKTGRDLYNLTKTELENLQAQREGQAGAQAKRLQQMLELQSEVNKAGYGKYVQYNQNDKTLEIDWDAIEAITDKDTYDEVTDYLKRMETVQDQMDDAEKALKEIDKRIQELEERFLEKYLDFQNRVLDAVVKQYQDAIDNLSKLNSALDDSNQSILDSIQKEIDLERQIRDNTDTESNIADMEARLAYLQRDTSGANDKEIRDLQKQLDDARESYSDTLIDQAIERLSQSNEEASEQRNKQVELMQAQLDYWKESGGLWEEVENLIATGFNSDGQLILGSELEKVLRNAENYDAMSEAQRENWANELILETNEVGAYIIKLNEGMELNAERVRALLEEISGKIGGTPEHSIAAKKDSGGGSGGGGDSSSKSGGDDKKPTGDEKPTVNKQVSGWKSNDTKHWKIETYYDGKGNEVYSQKVFEGDHIWKSDGAEYFKCSKCGRKKKKATTSTGSGGGGGGLNHNAMARFATGGLATQTGPAWLDGTPSEPEYVLNARQTTAFLRLAEVLPAAMNGGAPTTANYGGDIYLDLNMHVDEIASDYDVDRIADRVKEIIYDASSYRNVNTLNFIR